MFDAIKVDSLTALNDNIIVADMNFSGRKLSSGIYLLNDDMRTAGIRPRWAKVYAIGPDQNDISVGQWILVAHGRWTRGVKIEDQTGEITIRRIDPNDILLVSDTEPSDDSQSTADLVDSKSRW
jgi:hypothetical protein